MAELIGQYREAWQSAGHPGRGRVMLAFHMFCHSDGSTATQIAREPLDSYLGALAEAAAGGGFREPRRGTTRITVK